MSEDARRHASWYQEAVFYEVQIRSFFDGNDDGIGDFAGLTAKLDYLTDLGVTGLWLLPFYPSPLRDDGYDVADHTDIHADVGTLADFKHFLVEAQRRGLRVVTELVLNHTSDQHPWFQRSRRAEPGTIERDFYVWSDTPDRYVQAPILLGETERSNWSWDPVAKAHYWHRFHFHEPDLNFDNPVVRKTVLGIVDFWLGLGVDGVRLHGVPYFYEREGTTCENLPETHAFLRALRGHVDQHFPGRMLLAEAHQWPEDAVRYLEGGDQCHMALHCALMPRLFMAVHMEDGFPIADILAQTPALGDACRWALFLRNHDELTLDMLTDEERDYMYRAYARESSMRLHLGIRRRLAPLLHGNRRRIELLNGLLFSLPGTPVLYYGDEIGMGDNVHLSDRDGVRTPMQWSPDRNAGFSAANAQRLHLPVIIDPQHHYETVNVETEQLNPSSLLWWMKRLVALRKSYRAFARGRFDLLPTDNPRVLAFVREHEDERILVVANLSRFTQFVELDLGRYRGLSPIELFGRTRFPEIRRSLYPMTPGPHGFLWFSLERPEGARSSVRGSHELPELAIAGSWERLIVGRDRGALERVLSTYFDRCDWHRGAARPPKSLRISAAQRVPLGRDDSAHLLVVDVEHEDEWCESYWLPLCFETGHAMESIRPGAVVAVVQEIHQGEMRVGLLIDGLASERFCGALYQLLGNPRGVRRARETRIGASRLRWFGRSELRRDSLRPRVLSADESQTVIAFGGRLILKVLRPVRTGPHPDVEIGAFLTERARFPHVPRLAGWLELGGDGEGGATIGILRELPADSRDAWSFTREELRRYFDRVLARGGDAPERPRAGAHLVDLLDCVPPPAATELIGGFLGTAELLGRRTAELHLALAGDEEDPNFAPEPYLPLDQRSLSRSMRNLAHGALRLMQRRARVFSDLRSRDKELVSCEPQILARLEEFCRRSLTVVRMRHHGDYHLGRVLYTGKDFAIVDFEGEPGQTPRDRRRKRSALRDVAAMIRSFHYACCSALLEQRDAAALQVAHGDWMDSWSQVWFRWVSWAFLRAYVRTSGSAPFVPADRGELSLLLDVLQLERALKEVAHELKYRPQWIGIPLRGIHEVLAGASGGIAHGSP